MSVGVVAASATWIAPYSAIIGDLKLRLEAPNAAHWLGTDAQGRDVLSVLIMGSRTTLIVAFSSVGVAMVFGATMGMLSGFFRGLLDVAIMRLADLSFALPALLVALALAAAFGPSLSSILIIITLIYWGRFARTVRAEVLSLRERDYIYAARVVGASDVRILAKHMLPNILNLIIVMASLILGHVIVVEATLSFLGAGVPIGTPSWGRMVSDGREYLQDAWWLSLVPGLAILFLVLSVNMLGDWLRDHTDPRLRHR